MDIIWGADLVDIQLISRCNKGFRFLLGVIDIYSKYASFIPLTDKNGITITNAFQNFLEESNRKSSKIWVGKGSGFYNSSMKEKNDIEMYSTHNEGKSVIAKRFTRTWKSKIYKYMTSVSKTVYIDKLDETVNNYNKTYHTAVKIKPVDVKSNKYIDSIKEINNKKPKFKIGDTVRISKSKNIFSKGTLQISLKKFL